MEKLKEKKTTPNLLWEWSLKLMMMPTTIIIAMLGRLDLLFGSNLRGPNVTVKRSVVLSCAVTVRVSKQLKKLIVIGKKQEQAV
jgi:hypothetical protein